jgi:hypothetical protein
MKRIFVSVPSLLLAVLLMATALCGCNGTSGEAAVKSAAGLPSGTPGINGQGQPPAGEPPEGTPPMPAEGSGQDATTGATVGQPPSGKGGPDGGMPPDGQGGPGSGLETNGTAVTTFTTDATENGTAYTSTAADENALRVEGDVTVTLNNPVITKTEGNTSSADNSNFYGMNAAALVREGGSLLINGGTATTDVSGGNGLFCYGDGASLQATDTVIRTGKDNSGGIEVAGGGAITASNLDILTKGNSSAAIRSDRGGGTITLDGGTYVTNGTGSPAIYSTADITVSNASLNATASEGVVVEGKNSVTLNQCSLSGNMTGTYQGDETENLHTVMLYQSMSGDAEVGSARFSMTGGSLTGKQGDLFYVTNTTCDLYLEQVAISGADGALLTVAGNDGARGWGKAGSNGGNCSFTAKNQALSGNILCDDISTLDVKLSDGASLTGAINPQGAAGTVTLTLDDASTFTLTADSYVTTFNGSASNVKLNGHSLYVNGVKLA